MGFHGEGKKSVWISSSLKIRSVELEETGLCYFEGEIDL